MDNIFVLFDSRCDLCLLCKNWLSGQRQTVPITFIEAQSSEAMRIFPALDHARTLDDLTVITDDGAVYEGAKAWLMVLWALADYRQWAYQLASPAAMPVARQFIQTISKNRRALSRFLV